MLNIIIKNLNIPQKYTNFRLPEWQNLTVKELDKYIPPHASKFDWIDKNKKKIKKIQRTLFDLGINNNGVEVIRINSGTKTICDIGLSYNLDDYERDYGGDCELLYYKNDGYRIESSASLFIYKLLYPNTNSFSKERVCMISMN